MNALTIPVLTGAPVSLESDLDLAHELVREELAASTRIGYTRDVRLFATWCTSRGVSPMPAAPSTDAQLVREGRLRGAPCLGASQPSHGPTGSRANRIRPLRPTRTPDQR
jgi:hypothetical protein